MDTAAILAPFVGMKLKGFNDGYFGRDGHGDKIIEALGPDWIVARGYNEAVFFASAFNSIEDMILKIEEWRDSE